MHRPSNSVIITNTSSEGAGKCAQFCQYVYCIKMIGIYVVECLEHYLKKMILNKCSCFIEFIEPVGVKG